MPESNKRLFAPGRAWRVFVAAAALLVASAGGPARGEIIDWSVAVFQLFEQTASDTPPAAPVGFEIGGQLATTLPGEFDAVTLVSATGAAPPPIAFNPDGAVAADFELTEEVDTLAELNGVLPDGSYLIVASGGSLGPQSEPITVSGDFPAAVPFFTGPVFNALQGYNPALPLTLTYHTPPADGSAVFIYEAATGDEVFAADAFGDPSQTSATVPAMTLTAGVEYDLVLDFFSVTPDPREGFTTGEGLTAKVNSTIITFTPVVVPEPAAVVLLGLAVGLVKTRRRRRTGASASHRRLARDGRDLANG